MPDQDPIIPSRITVTQSHGTTDVDSVVWRVAAASAHKRPCTSPALTCPRCAGTALEVFRRYEVVTAVELRYCPKCLGFWAAGDALVRGIADPYDEHAALRAAPAPDRCRECLGYFNPEGKCRKCGKKRPDVACPCCGRPMKANPKGVVRLDACDACSGTWFDGGEITAAYSMAPMQGLAASTVGDDGPANGDLFREAVNIVLGTVFPLLRF